MGRRLHFIGIAGIGMSAIARVMLQRGDAISGSDLRPNALTEALARAGAQVYLGHQPEHVHGADLVIVSSAVPDDNPEMVEARRLGIPVVKRSEFLNEVIGEQRAIAIAGTHGKTTTTAMVAWLLTEAGLDPSFIVGGVIPALKSNARAGRGSCFVIEADEYDRMFLGLHPWVCVVTNIELDHVDCYPCLEDAQQAFVEFAGNTASDGIIFVGAESPTALDVARLATAAPRSGTAPNVMTYGLGLECDWRADNLVPNELGGTTFTVFCQGSCYGQFETAIPGAHNVGNALAAIAVGAFLNLEPVTMARALKDFRGASRRFEIKGEADGVVVVDDYAHHPTEIRATLAAARERFPGQRLWAVFQPHTYSRTSALFDMFTRCFEDAQRVVILDIYAAREKDDGRVSGAELARHIELPSAVQYMGGIKQAAEYVLDHVAPGDVVITLGAGDGYLVGEKVLAGLFNRGSADGA